MSLGLGMLLPFCCHEQDGEFAPAKNGQTNTKKQIEAQAFRGLSGLAQEMVSMGSWESQDPDDMEINHFLQGANVLVEFLLS